MATVTSHYPRAALFGAHQQGLNIELLRERAGISEELINTVGSRVHVKQMTRLVKLIWQQLEDEFMGFTEHRCKQGCFAMMCQLVSRCETVDALLLQGIRFYDLVTDDIVMEYRQLSTGREFVVTMALPAKDPEHFFLEFWLVIWHRFASWAIGRQIKLQAAHFAYPEPDYSTEFKYQFACPCYFNAQETKLCFSNQYASLPPVRTQRELARFLKRSPADLLTIPGDDSSLTRSIKGLLLNDAEQVKTFPELDELAAAVHMSPQTLRRKLKDEGTSYQKIKDTIRCDIAIEKLNVQHMAVNDVAEILGFAESRSFTRAFKQWTGVTPSAYRNNS